MTDFDTALQAFVEGCQRIHSAHMSRYPNVPADIISARAGKRYVRIIRNANGVGGSVHCFVDMTNGDVLKAAGWKTPAKRAGGNIFDEHNGLKSMGEYGPASLR